MKKKAPERRSGRLGRKLTPGERDFVGRVGAAIKARRTGKSISAAQMASDLGVSLNTQFRREAGRVGMPLEELHRYAAALGCKPEDLVKG